MKRCDFCGTSENRLRPILLPYLKYPRDWACPKCTQRLLRKGAKRWRGRKLYGKYKMKRVAR